MRNTILLILIWGFLTGKGFSQESAGKTAWQPGATCYYGFIFPHTTKIEYLVRDHVSGLDLFIARTAISENIYDQLFNYPLIGVGVFHASLQNPEALGSVNSIISFLNAPVYRFSDKSELDYQLSAGLTYLTKKFDLYDNNLNVAIGSHLNLHFTAMLGYRIRVLEYFEWKGGVSFSHFSNGRVVLPNLGINYVSAFTGISYNISRVPLRYPERIIPVFDRFNEHMLVLSLGIKQYEIEDTDYYLIQSISYDFGRRFQQHIKLSAGPDLFYDASTKKSLEHNGRIDYRLPDLCRLGVHMGFHLTYRNLTMVVMEGFYLYSGYTPPSTIYNRLGLQYRVSDHFLVNASLKSHKIVADFVEWGVGYVFFNK